MYTIINLGECPTIIGREGANVVYKWKRQLLDNLARAFDAEAGSAGNTPEREAELLQKIGELTVERDFLSSGLGRFR